MSIVEAFSSYAQAYLETFEDGDWSRLESYFSPNIVFLPGDGSELRGRLDVLDHLRESWGTFDRLFDSRSVELTSPPVVTITTVTIQWKAVYQKSGLPNLVLAGSEEITFDGNAVSRLEDSADDDVMEALEKWKGEYGAKLAE